MAVDFAFSPEQDALQGDRAPVRRAGSGAAQPGDRSHRLDPGRRGEKPGRTRAAWHEPRSGPRRSRRELGRHGRRRRGARPGRLRRGPSAHPSRAGRPCGGASQRGGAREVAAEYPGRQRAVRVRAHRTRGRFRRGRDHVPGRAEPGWLPAQRREDLDRLPRPGPRRGRGRQDTQPARARDNRLLRPARPARRDDRAVRGSRLPRPHPGMAEPHGRRVAAWRIASARRATDSAWSWGSSISRGR